MIQPSPLKVEEKKHSKNVGCVRIIVWEGKKYFFISFLNEVYFHLDYPKIKFWSYLKFKNLNRQKN